MGGDQLRQACAWQGHALLQQQHRAARAGMPGDDGAGSCSQGREERGTLCGGRSSRRVGALLLLSLALSMAQHEADQVLHMVHCCIWWSRGADRTIIWPCGDSSVAGPQVLLLITKGVASVS
jgi:hypothetical protein